MDLTARLGLMVRLLHGLAAAPSEQIIWHRNVRAPTASDLTCRVVRELANPTEPVYGEMLCLAMTVHLLRQYRCTGLDALRFKARLSAVQTCLVLDYMHANLGGRLTVSVLAHEVGLSEAYFARAFHATFKKPPHRLVLRWRLERAARLVAKTGYSLAEAAMAAGFCDQAHLTNAMRRHFGKTPGNLPRPE
jgi:AraC family transcriptional regulator